MKKKLKRLFSFAVCFIFLFSVMLTGAVSKPLTVSAAQISAGISLTDSNITDLNTPVTVNLSMNGFPYTGTVAEPNDVILLIDRSGSMHNDYADMIAAAKTFVNKLDLSTHRIGIVLYESGIDSLRLTNDKTEIIKYLDDALAKGTLGSTAMHLGINEGINMLKSKRSSAHGAMVLMTDGQPDNRQAAENAAKTAKTDGYAFYTVALCPSEDSPANVMLKAMATTESSHYSVFSTSKLNSVYSSIANNIGKVNAKNIKVVQTIGDAFEYVPGSADNSIPLPSYVSSNRLEWDINELAPGTSNISYKVRLKSEYTEYKLECISGEITYTNYNGAVQTINIRPNYAYNEMNGEIEITSVSPDSIEKKEAATLTITGKGFFGTVITYSGFTLFPKSVNEYGTEMVVDVPAVSQSGVKKMTIKNDRGNTAETDITVYAITTPTPTTVITSCTPDTVTIKETTMVTLTGENFNDPKVYVDGTLMSSDKYQVSDDGKTLTVEVYIRSAKNFSIAIQGKGCYKGSYTLKSVKTPPVPKAVPTITSISPDSVTQKDGETAITVTGTNLNNLQTFSVTGTKLTAADCTVSPDGTQLQFTLPEQATVKNLTVSITTSEGSTSGTISVNKKTYSAPAITGCNLTEYKKKTATEIVLTGENFSDVTTVTYNQFIMSSFTVSADGKTLSFTPASYNTLSVKPNASIVVKSPGGSDSYALPIVA